MEGVTNNTCDGLTLQHSQQVSPIVKVTAAEIISDHTLASAQGEAQITKSPSEIIAATPDRTKSHSRGQLKDEKRLSINMNDQHGLTHASSSPDLLKNDDQHLPQPKTPEHSIHNRSNSEPSLSPLATPAQRDALEMSVFHKKIAEAVFTKLSLNH